MAWLSIERYFIVNFMMNLVLLLLTLRSAGQPARRSAWIAAAIGTLYAMLCAVSPKWSAFPLQILLMIAMLLISGGIRCIRLPAIGAMLSAVWICAGAMEYALSRNCGMGMLPPVAAAVVILCRRQDRKRLEIHGLEMRLKITCSGRSTEIVAWLDTGNRLQEMLSGLPVLIVEERSVAAIAPVSASDFRHIPYSGLGSTGFLEAFRPDSVHCAEGAGWRELPPVYVALFPGRISGHVHALAPPAFALQSSPQRTYERREG